MSGLTPTGFEIKRLTEIKADIEDSLTRAFGDIDLRGEGVFGQLVGISAEVDAILWQMAEDVYFSQYPDFASGVSLDHVCALNGVYRIPAFPTQARALLSGQKGTIVSSGRQATSSQTGDVYQLVTSVEINEADAVEARIGIASNGAGAYTVTIRGTDYTYTSAGGETDQEILTGVQSALSSAVDSSSVQDGFVQMADTAPMALELTANLSPVLLAVEADFRAIETGPLPLSAGDLSEIKTPVAGWDGITNPSAGVLGRSIETDSQLRARRQKTIQVTATNTIDAIYSRLRNLRLVTDVNVTANSGTATDADGTDPQHVWAIVEGGEDDEIASVLFNAVAAGIGMRGGTSVNVTSEISGKTYVAQFDRPTYLEPDIEVTYSRLAGFPAEGEGLIRAALASRTFEIGEKLIISRLYTPINSVPGFEVDGITVDAGTANIVPAPNEKVRILPGNITFVDAT